MSGLHGLREILLLEAALSALSQSVRSFAARSAAILGSSGIPIKERFAVLVTDWDEEIDYEIRELNAAMNSVSYDAAFERRIHDWSKETKSHVRQIQEALQGLLTNSLTKQAKRFEYFLLEKQSELRRAHLELLFDLVGEAVALQGAAEA